MKYALSREQLEAISRDPWLTDRERQVFDLYYRRGWRIEDVAAEIDRNRRTVDRTLRRIRQRSALPPS